MTKLYAYAAMLLLAALIVAACTWYVDSLKSHIAIAAGRQAVAEAQSNSCASSLAQANAATEAAEAKAKLMHDHAQALIDSTAGEKAKNNAGGTTFAEKVTHNAKAPDCQAVLEAQLCPALSGY